MTYKNMLLGRLRYLILFLVAVQSVLFALMAIFFTGVEYQESWRGYNHKSETVTIYLQKLSEEQSRSVFQFFLERNDLSIWTKHSETSDSGEGLNRIYIDILGNPEGFSDFVSNAKTVVSQYQIEELLAQNDNNKTIGLSKGSENMLYELPTIWFMTPVVIDRLDGIFQKAGIINGIYYINGLNDSEEREVFLSEVSNISGISVANLTRESFGSSVDYGIWPIVLAISIVANALVLLVVYLICVLQSFKLFGTLILLGWDRKSLCIALFKDSFLFSIFAIPVSSLMLWIISGWSSIGLRSFVPIFVGSSFSILLLSLIIIVPSTIIYFVSPLVAIHKRLPMKPLMVISLLFYTLVAGLLMTVSHALDAPMDQFMDNVKISREWKNVEDMYVISSFVEGDDIGTYAGTTNSLENSMYRLYQRISEIPGVYLAQGEYLDKQYLDIIYGTYQNVPRKPFWYMTYSYHYLLDLGIELNDEDLSEIKSGTRLYLIPNSLNTEEVEIMKAYFQEMVRVKPGDLSTKFTENPRFLFKVYQPSKSILTWSSATSNGVTTEAPVIFVAAPENLYFMESANLFISGYDGFLKVRDKEKMSQVKSILKNEFPDLADNKIQFETVKNYINGLQKDLSYTFYLFGSVILIIVMTLIAVFWSFVLIYRLLFEEKLYVQYFMGFSPWRRYSGILSLIVGASMVELLVSLLLSSKLGILLTIATFILQIVFLYFYTFYKESDHVLRSFKG